MDMKFKFGTMPLSENVLKTSQSGLWAFELDDGGEPRMYVDDCMLKLIGLEEQTTPELTYHAWYDHIDSKHYPEVHESVELMKNGSHAEVQFPWHHPNGTTMIVRCSGVRNYDYKKGIRIEGIHSDVTHLYHIQKKDLQESLIEGLSREYHTVWLLNSKKELTLYRSTGNNTITKAVQLGLDVCDYEKAINIYANDFVCECDRKRFISETKWDELKKKVPMEGTYVVTYRRKKNDNEIDYHQICYARTKDTEGVEAYVLAYRNANEQIKEEIRKNEILIQNMQLVSGLASEYIALFHVNLNTGKYSVYSLDGKKFPEVESLTNKYNQFADVVRSWLEADVIYDGDKKIFEQFLNYDTIRELLAKQKKYTHYFRRKYNGNLYWNELNLIKYENVNEKANIIAVGFIQKDGEIRAERIINNCLNVMVDENFNAKSVNELLKNAIEYYDADRAYVFEIDETGNLLNNTYESVKEGVSPEIDRLQGVSISEASSWFEAFKKNGSFYINEVTASSAGNEYVKELLEIQNIKSLIAAPIIHRDKIIGFFGIDNPKRDTDNYNFLKTFSRIIYSEILVLRETSKSRIFLESLSFAIRNSYPLVVVSNIDENTYKILEYGESFNHTAESTGTFDDLITVGASTIPDEDQAKKFYDLFCRESVKNAFNKGIHSLTLRHQQYNNDQKGISWMETSCLITEIDGVLYATSLSRNITEELKQEEIAKKTLEDAYKKAESASQAKTSFLFNMSHDIRTPINAITGFNSMAIRNIDNKEKVLNCLKKTQIASETLLNIINDILEMSRIESGKIVFEQVKSDVYSSFSSIEDVTRALASDKNIDLTFNFGNIKNRYVYADVVHCNRIFMNIITNAIKYTNNGGRVEVRCEQISDPKDDCIDLKYTFKDNGIGISEEFQKHMFEEFSRENNSTVSKTQGTGLGLALCKNFADLMGATITCESKQNVGSTFTVILPVKIQKKEQYDSNNKLIANNDIKDLHGKRVLLVEDNEMNREIARDLLEELGIIVTEADDGTRALEIISNEKITSFDAILMDIQMPCLNGYETTRQIRNEYKDCHIPIIALSANAFDEDRQKSIEAGMDDHLAKPIDNKKIIKTLSDLIK